jgi:hypothetical protein
MDHEGFRYQCIKMTKNVFVLVLESAIRLAAETQQVDWLSDVTSPLIELLKKTSERGGLLKRLASTDGYAVQALRDTIFDERDYVFRSDDRAGLSRPGVLGHASHATNRTALEPDTDSASVAERCHRIVDPAQP